MTPEEMLDILERAGKLKTARRHCWLEENRQESVADHSWRMALMAMLYAQEEEYRSYDMDKVIRMCLIHDLGETFTGDIPVFVKTDDQRVTEDELFLKWVQSFPEAQRQEWLDLLDEMERQETNESKLYKALDKMEAVISHNESDLSTWLPLEYDLQFTHGVRQVQFSKNMRELKAAVDRWTEEKIAGKDE